MLDSLRNPIDEIHSVRALVKDVETALRSQQQILQMRGMNLPQGTFQTLSGMVADLDALEPLLVDETTEYSQLRALAGTSEKMNSSLDLDEVLVEAMDNVINLTGAERGYIVLTSPFSDELEFRISRDAEQQDKQGRVTFQGSRTILNEVLKTGSTLLTDNAYNDPRMQDNVTVARLTLRSVLCVPLKLKDHVIGAVYVDNRLRAGIFTQREATLLTAFANQAAVAIENARLYSRVQTAILAITELKELMDSVFESIGSGVITTNHQDVVTLCNRAAAQILWHDDVRPIGRPLSVLLPNSSVSLEEQLRVVREQGEICALETEVDDPRTRERLILNLRLSPLKDAGGTQGTAIVLDDLTAQRKNEETLSVMNTYLPEEVVKHIQSIAQLALGGERREITCMFADVRPISTFPPDLQPAEMMEMLNRHLTVASDCIMAAEGIVDKYMGHEVMGLFNSQINPQAVHAALAVEAALRMRSAFLRLYQELGVHPGTHYYRVGIHTGIATLGNVGSLNRRDFTAIGDTINSAKRLQENSRVGQIIVSEDTLQHIKATTGLPQNVRFQPSGEIQGKGKTRAIRIYEVFQT